VPLIRKTANPGQHLRRAKDARNDQPQNQNPHHTTINTTSPAVKLDAQPWPKPRPARAGHCCGQHRPSASGPTAWPDSPLEHKQKGFVLCAGRTEWRNRISFCGLQPVPHMASPPAPLAGVDDKGVRGSRFGSSFHVYRRRQCVARHRTWHFTDGTPD